MSHQYPPTSLYGAPYPGSSFYSTFAPSAGQQLNNGPSPFQQPNGQGSTVQSPPVISNATRYDANANIHHQPVPLHFAPHLNPELLKHFPPPPPPLIPPSFAHFPLPINTPPVPMPPQHYSHIPQPVPPAGNGYTSGQASTLLEDPKAFGHTTPVQEASGFVDRLSKQASSKQSMIDSPSLGSSGKILGAARGSENIHGAPLFPAARTHASHPLPEITPIVEQQTHGAHTGSVSQQIESGHNSFRDSQNPVPNTVSRSELKERAKAALLSLVPYNIRYENLRAEGVSSPTLQKLYQELGLNWQSPSDKPDTRKAPNVPTTHAHSQSTGNTEQERRDLQTQPITAPSNPVVAKNIPVAAPLPRTSPSATQNLERKDRIAQLLAAKAGKSGAPAHISKSQSPASPSENITPQSSETLVATSTATPTLPTKPSRNVAQAEIVKQKMELLKREAMTKAQAEHLQPAFASSFANDRNLNTGTSMTQEDITLPTPIREHLAQNGFSSLIPGLFMTSADPEETSQSTAGSELPVSLDDADLNHMENLTPAHVHDDSTQKNLRFTQSSQKRPMTDDFGEMGSPQAKRQATGTPHSADLPTDMEEDHDGDDASEGEVFEQESTDHQMQEKSSSEAPPMPILSEEKSRSLVGRQAGIEGIHVQVTEMAQYGPLKRDSSHITSPGNSMTSTPVVSQPGQNVLSSPITKMLAVPSSVPKLNDRAGQSPRRLLKATQEQIAERAAQLKADFLRQRALRQKQLQDGIPALNDEVAKTRIKLTEVRQKLAKVQTDLHQYEASVVRAREDEKELLREIERLQTQISEGVSGQKQFSSELNDLKQDTNKVLSAQASVTPSNKGEPALGNMTNTSQAIASPPRSLSGQEVSHSSGPGSTTAISEETSAQALTSRMSRQSPLLTPSTDVRSTQQNHNELDMRLDPSFAEVVGSRADAMNIELTSTPESSDVVRHKDENHGQESDEEAMQESDDGSDDSHMSIDDETDDSVSMSGSGSEEYEPAEPGLSQDSDTKMESDEYEPEIEDGQVSDVLVDEDADDYEPAESLSPEHSSELTPVIPQQFTASNKQPEINHQDDGLQLTEVATLTKTQDNGSRDEQDKSEVLGTTQSSTVRFVPYQSPLTSFKSYRFHPYFNQQVKDGYRSLTYSHKIDPKTPVCPTELGGVVCTDPQCQDQHFGSMALSDDKILVQMSSASDIKDKTLRDQYLIGLKQVIAKLRQEGVKEFSAVADALSQYRRQWTASQASS